MRHRIKKIKFKSGFNAGKSLKRKLIKNFILRGKITATDKKIKFLKTEIQSLMTHAKKGDSTSSRTVLMSRIGDKRIVDMLVTHVSPVFKSRQGGYVKNALLPQRASDGARMATLEWVEPVVFPTQPKKEKKTKTTEKAEKSQDKKESKIKAKKK